jgi:hypothetical protein
MPSIFPVLTKNHGENEYWRKNGMKIFNNMEIKQPNVL